MLDLEFRVGMDEGHTRSYRAVWMICASSDQSSESWVRMSDGGNDPETGVWPQIS